MGSEENLIKLKERLAGVPELTDRERDVLTSDVLLKRIMPLMTAFTTAAITGAQEVKDKTGENLAALAKQIMDSPGDIPDVQGFVKDIAAGNFNADWVEGMINTLSQHWLAGPIFSLVIAGLHAMTSVYGFATVSSERTRQIAMETIKPYLLDINSLIEEYFRHPNNYAFVIDQFRKMGIDDKKIDVLLDNQTNLLPIDMLRMLWNREEITTDEMREELRKQRFNPDDFELIEKVFKQYPSVSDFVLFSVREAYDEGFVSDAGLGSDMPNEFLDDARKAGLPEHYARKYWYSHWQPPSVGQAFELLHRGIIDEEEVDTLLRINDIMPNYRQKMVALSYNTIGRVDIRRLYQDGVIEYEAMYNMYLANGQSPDNAELLSEWTELHYGEDRRQRNRTDIIKLYKLGTYNKLQAIEGIQSIGYSEDIAEEFVTRVDLEKAEKHKANKIKIWSKGFINYVYDETQVRTFMLAVGMKKKEQDDLIQEWKVGRDSKVTWLTIKHVEAMFTENIMSQAEVLDELSMQGYQTTDINRLLLLWRK